MNKKEYALSYYHRNRERIRAQAKNRSKQNREEYNAKARIIVRAWSRSFFGRKSIMYHSIRNRLKKNPVYKNRTLGFSREDFLKFLESNNDYARIYAEWVENGFDMRFTPTVDRIDNTKGYELDNIQVISFSENVKKRFA